MTHYKAPNLLQQSKTSEWIGLLVLCVLSVFLILPHTAAWAQDIEKRPYTVLFYESDALPDRNPFIAMARQGAAEAREEFGLEFIEHPVADETNRQAELESVAASGARLVVTLGFKNVAPVLKIAKHFPDVQFTIIDGASPPLYSNVQSILFKDNEGAFLVGMVAALSTRSNAIGFIGGMDVPLIRNFAYGYEQGASYVNSEVKVLRDMIGDTPAAWDNPTRGAELARKQFEEGADIIFAAAGASGRGVLNAAYREGHLAIGVDTNQNATYPGAVLTSMVKRVDKVVYDAIKQSLKGKWEPGSKHLGIREGALDYAVDKHNRTLLSKEIIDRVEEARDRIIRGLKVVEPYTPY